MSARVKKIICLLVALALVFASGQVEKSLNRDRDSLGLTRMAVLDNAPPVLAFTTVALGGFRGLVSNLLWIRANDLQQDDRFFEAAQLADWITKLEPTFTQVWLFQGWNMAYNISVKFKDFKDRWRWVENGIELLRDNGLQYNQDSLLIYRELAWFFQHKMGANLDDANIYYKMRWAAEMTPFFGPQGTNFTMLLHPANAQEQKLANILQDKYKINPAFAKSVDDQYGPMDWRLPETHAIYWGAKGLEEAAKHPDRVKADDLITLRRIVYQSMLQSFHHGRIISEEPFALGPNLDLVGQVDKAYMQSYADEKSEAQKDGILRAHRNFLRDAIYFLYTADRMGEAQKWFKYLGDKYPDKAIIENRPDSLPATLTLDEYAVAVVQIDIGETSRDRVTSAVQGLLLQSYHALALGEDDRYVTLKNLAARVYANYTSKTSKFNGDKRIPLPPYNEMQAEVLNMLLDPKHGIPYAARAALRTQLGLPSEGPIPLTAPTTAVPATETNGVPEAGTNAAAVAP